VLRFHLSAEADLDYNNYILENVHEGLLEKIHSRIIQTFVIVDAAGTNFYFFSFNLFQQGDVTP
jgi:hypothetical protein